MMDSVLREEKIKIIGMPEIQYEAEDFVDCNGGCLLNTTFDGCVIDDCVWFVTYYNCLVSIDIKTRKIKLARQLPYSVSNFGYVKILHDRDYIFILPYNSLYLIQYNILSGELKSYKVSDNGNANYYTGFLYDGNVYMVPAMTNEIKTYNIKDKTISTLIDMTILPYIKKDREISRSIFFDNGIMYCLISATNKVFAYNISEQNYSTIKINKKLKFAKIVKAADGFLAAAMDEPCAVYVDLRNGRQVTFMYSDLIEPEYRENGFELLSINEKAVLIPYFCKYGVFIDVTANSIYKKELVEDGLKTGIPIACKGEICYLPLITGNEIIFSSSEKITIDRREFMSKYTCDFTINENKYISLTEYIDLIEKTSKSTVVKREACGKRIYDVMK